MGMNSFAAETHSQWQIAFLNHREDLGADHSKDKMNLLMGNSVEREYFSGGQVTESSIPSNKDGYSDPIVWLVKQLVYSIYIIKFLLVVLKHTEKQDVSLFFCGFSLMDF